MTLYLITNVSTVASRDVRNYLKKAGKDFVWLRSSNWSHLFTKELFLKILNSTHVMSGEPPSMMADIVKYGYRYKLEDQNVDLDDLTVDEAYQFLLANHDKVYSGFLFNDEREVFYRGFTEDAMQIMTRSKEDKARTRAEFRRFIRAQP